MTPPEPQAPGQFLAALTTLARACLVFCCLSSGASLLWPVSQLAWGRGRVGASRTGHAAGTGSKEELGSPSLVYGLAVPCHLLFVEPVPCARHSWHKAAAVDAGPSSTLSPGFSL